MSHLAIVNPRAGGGSRSRAAARRARLVDRVRPHASEIAVTEYEGHAREIAKQATTYDGLIVVGGDGTVCEVLNGMALDRQRLAIVPTGRANSLARDLRLFPASLAIAALAAGNTAHIDLIDVVFEDYKQLRGRVVCASAVGVGYPAAVVRLAAARFAWLGTHSYSVAAACVRPTPMRVRIDYDGGSGDERVLTGVIANNTRYLANFVSAPKAVLNDGRFDVTEMNARTVSQNLHNLSALSGLPFHTPARVTQASALALACEDPQSMLVDGELYADVVAFTAHARPRAVDVVHGFRPG